jgi:drug/metabolite transporter (DMT)-like permease
LQNKNLWIGIGLAVLATIIWSGNFVVARGVYKEIPPVSLSFYRWSCATLIILPFAWKTSQREWPVAKRSWKFLLGAALAGITLFNTFVYIGAQYTSAINLALIGTTSSPIIAVILAAIFLKEKVGWKKILGMIFCVAGVLFLIAKGHLPNLLHLKFTRGDGWVLLAACAFAVYNTMVKRKPAAISPVNFLFMTFLAGTLMLVPFFIWEQLQGGSIIWTGQLIAAVLYLGIGASVISFMLWNRAIQCLGAGRTALFGNLIPIFSSLEAVYLLGEQVSWVQVLSFALVLVGLFIANLRQ